MDRVDTLLSLYLWLHRLDGTRGASRVRGRICALLGAGVFRLALLVPLVAVHAQAGDGGGG